MNLASNCCKLVGTRACNVYKFGGYLCRKIATIEDYKIKWTRPPKIPKSDPKQSGDLGLNIVTKRSDIKLYYENSKELENASDLVKRIFTLEFQRNKEDRNLKREKAIALVKRHICDRGSHEVKIAAMTSEIQFLQECIKKHPRNRKIKVFLLELIDKRNKFLRLLRTWDYKRFEWILERLNLTYKPQPEKIGMVSRKESLTKLTEAYCNNIIQKKLDTYKDELKKQQKLFYIEKAEKLELILKEEKEYGLTPTVTEEDIEAARKKAEILANDNV